jgi:hypothetical protein
MTDGELQGRVLQKFYERRRGAIFEPQPEDFGGELSHTDIMSICDQLGELGLITWKPIPLMGETMNGMGKISAFGVAVAEGREKPPISLVLDQSIKVSHSSNVQIGNSNSQAINSAVEQLVRVVDESKGTQGEKSEAKSRLQAFLAHPLVCAIAGGAAGGLTSSGS